MRSLQNRNRGITVVLLLLAVRVPVVAFPVNNWKHIGSDHFVVSYSPRTEHLATRTLSIAEETIGTLAEYFGYRIGGRKISIVLVDQYDDPNGSTSMRDPVVTIDCRQAQSLFRGRADWLRAVLTHELSHAYSLAVLNFPIAFATSVGILSTAENLEASAYQYWGGSRIPLWFVEGIVQLGSHRVDADSMDPVREMVLRDAVHSGTLLTLAQMARFEGTSLDYELVYNQGFAFLLYLQETHPEVKLSELCLSVRVYGLGPALQSRYQKTAQVLWQEWVDQLNRKYSGLQTWDTGKRLSGSTGPMLVEVASARAGDYVLANWGNDYLRYGLFRRTRGQTYMEIARDTGTVLREDRGTGEIWFNKYTYSHSTGVDNVEVFRIDVRGGYSRVTVRSRSLAFDALDGHLVYAAYESDKTVIVQRKPDESETTLYELPDDLAVYGLSLITPETTLLSLGTRQGARLAVLAGGRLTYLWKDHEILDPVYAGNNRILFSATASGTPQIYWANLGEDAGTWYQITAAPAGARFPSPDSSAGSDGISFAVFEQGGYRLYTADNALTRDHPLQIQGPATETLSLAPEDIIQVHSSKRLLNPVLAYPGVGVGVTAQRAPTDSGVQTLLMGDLGLAETVYSAPGNASIQVSGALSYPFYPANPLPPALLGSVQVQLDAGPLVNTLGYTIETTSYLPAWAETVYTYLHQRVHAETGLQLASHMSAGAYYTLAWHVDTTDKANAVYLLKHFGGIQLRYAYAPTSVFDPAHLGQPLLGLSVGGDIQHSSFPAQEYYDPAVDMVEPHLTFDAFAAAELRVVLFGSRLSVHAEASWFSFLLAADGARLTPFLLPAIGGGDDFSGYPEDYATVNDLGHGSIEIFTNPLVNKNSSTRWYQRLRLGARVDAGLARYVDQGLVWGYPVSVEVSLRQFFYLVPNRQSSVFIRAAFPLNDFLATVTAPYQIYAGYSF